MSVMSICITSKLQITVKAQLYINEQVISLKVMFNNEAMMNIIDKSVVQQFCISTV